MTSEEILIIGTEPPCPRCDYLTRMVNDIVSTLGVPATVRHISYEDEEARRFGASLGLIPGTAKDVARKTTVDVDWGQIHALIDGPDRELSCCSTVAEKWSPELDRALRPCECMAHDVGIMMTPVLIIGGRLFHQGSVPERLTVTQWIKEFVGNRSGNPRSKHLVEILGPGCKKCDTLYDNVRQAVAKIDFSDRITIRKRTDVNYFHEMSVFVTPAMVINGSVVSKGKVTPVDQITDQLSELLSIDVDRESPRQR